MGMRVFGGGDAPAPLSHAYIYNVCERGIRLFHTRPATPAAAFPCVRTRKYSPAPPPIRTNAIDYIGVCAHRPLIYIKRKAIFQKNSPKDLAPLAQRAYLCNVKRKERQSEDFTPPQGFRQTSDGGQDK